jgi:hypothetical protein
MLGREITRMKSTYELGRIGADEERPEPELAEDWSLLGDSID